MIRQIIILGLLLLTPTVGYYFLCLFLAKKKKVQLKKWSEFPWVPLLGGGLALAIIALVTLSFSTGYDKDTIYIPAHMQDGVLIPAQNIDPKTNSESVK